MEDSKFVILSALIKLNKEFTYQEAENHLRSDIDVYEYLDYINEYLPSTLNHFFEQLSPGYTDSKYRISKLGKDAYSREIAKKAKEKQREDNQDQLTRSNINSNLFIKFTFIISLLGLVVQIYSASKESEQTKIQLHIDTSQSMQQIQQGSQINELYGRLDSLESYSQKKDTTNH